MSGVFSSAGDGHDRVTSIDVDVARGLLINSGHHYLDVRTREEFDNGHLNKAFNIPYMFDTPQGRVKNPNFIDQVMQTYQKDDHIVVGCRSGVRSMDATLDLINADFRHVYNLEGGYIAWLQKGFAVAETHRQEL